MLELVHPCCGVGERVSFLKFFYTFLNWYSVSLTPVLMGTAAVHPKDSSRSRLSEGWDAVAPVSGCSRWRDGSDEPVSHDFHMDLVLQ